MVNSSIILKSKDNIFLYGNLDLLNPFLCPDSVLRVQEHRFRAHAVLLRIIHKVCRGGLI